jgi:dTDP-glucose pyrophosphorylase
MPSHGSAHQKTMQHSSLNENVTLNKIKMTSETKIKVGVIPAAGQGKRMGYLSHILPKPLLPLYDRPIIHYVIKNMEEIGIEEVYIPVFFQKEKIKEYFKAFKSNIIIRIIELDQPSKGIADTIASTERFINEPFMVILGDDITITPSLANVVKTFFEKNAIVVEGAVKEKSIDVLKSTCCLKIDENKKIVEIIEKPAVPISNIRGIGVYVFSPEIFDFIKQTPISPPRNEIEITNTIKLIAHKGRAYAEFIRGININVNTPEDLYRAWSYYRKIKRQLNNRAV